MAVVLIVLLGLVIFPSEEIKEFGRHSNGVQEYVFVTSKACPSGLRKSGYSYAPGGHVVLKQKNLDGTVSEPVCSD